MHALEHLAVGAGLSHRGTLTPVMYRSFNHFACVLGNLSEFRFTIWFYLLTNPFRHLSMIPIAFNMFKRGRLSIRARRLTPEGTAQLRAILDKAESLGVLFEALYLFPGLLLLGRGSESLRTVGASGRQGTRYRAR
jgi:hypothetical protein